MKIAVTQEHIDKGLRSRCKLCPVALALHDSGFPEAMTGLFHCWLNGLRSGARLLPGPVTKFILGFDNGKVYKPFDFELET